MKKEAIMKNFIKLTTFAIFLTSCANNQPSNTIKPTQEIYNISNQGTICVEKIAPKRLKFTYFPLNKICVPSSNYKINISDIEVTPAGVAYKVRTFTNYIKYNNSIATTDCGNAGQKEDIVPILGIGNVSIMWGYVLAGKFSNRVGDITCFRKTKNNTYIDTQFIKEYKYFKNMQKSK
jgi:hypothetical protein